MIDVESWRLDAMYSFRYEYRCTVTRVLMSSMHDAPLVLLSLTFNIWEESTQKCKICFTLEVWVGSNYPSCFTRPFCNMLHWIPLSSCTCSYWCHLYTMHRWRICGLHTRLCLFIKKKTHRGKSLSPINIIKWILSELSLCSVLLPSVSEMLWYSRTSCCTSSRGSFFDARHNKITSVFASLCYGLALFLSVSFFYVIGFFWNSFYTRNKSCFWERLHMIHCLSKCDWHKKGKILRGDKRKH